MNNQLQSTSIKLPSTMNKSTFLLKKMFAFQLTPEISEKKEQHCWRMSG